MKLRQAKRICRRYIYDDSIRQAHPWKKHSLLRAIHLNYIKRYNREYDYRMRRVAH